MSTVHNPVNFEPSDYEVEDYLDNKRPIYFGQGVPAFEEEVKWWEADMLRTFGTDWRKKVHHCIHCGNGMVRWITAVKHAPTGETVVFGSDCTKRLGFADKHSFKLAQLQSRAAARQVRFAIWNKRIKFLEANPGIAEALEHIEDPCHAENHFVKDVLRKLDLYGDLSPKQVTAVEESMTRDRIRMGRQAAEAVEIKGDAPSGRTDVTGVVLSIKEQESDFGLVRKMLVKLDNNAKVWCTVPGGCGAERNARITIRATWTPSQDDKSFAFGSRPMIIG